MTSSTRSASRSRSSSINARTTSRSENTPTNCPLGQHPAAPTIPLSTRISAADATVWSPWTVMGGPGWSATTGTSGAGVVTESAIPSFFPKQPSGTKGPMVTSGSDASLDRCDPLLRSRWANSPRPSALVQILRSPSLEVRPDGDRPPPIRSGRGDLSAPGPPHARRRRRVCVYHRGEPVIDMWGGHRTDDHFWEPDTVAMCFSTTKA